MGAHALAKKHLPQHIRGLSHLPMCLPSRCLELNLLQLMNPTDLLQGFTHSRTAIYQSQAVLKAKESP